MNYVVRTRKVADSSLKMYFYKTLKSIYLFDNVDNLEKVYDLKVYLNNGLTI